MQPHFIPKEDSEQEEITCAEITKKDFYQTEVAPKIAEAQLPLGFFFTEEDLMFQPEARGDKAPPAPVLISSKLEVIARTRDSASENHGYLLQFKDADDVIHQWAMPAELLAGDGTDYRRELLSKGLRIAPGKGARDLLTNYIQSSKPQDRVRCVAQTGWYDSCFVLPDQTIGPCERERIMLQVVNHHFAKEAFVGTLEEWQREVSALCMGNSKLIFAVSTTFAATLLHLLGMESGGFHFRGRSSTGKTTLLMVAASVWGGGKSIQRWRATTNGLESLAASHNDALLCLDELSQIDPREAGDAAYTLANGAGKTRADRHGGPRKASSWRLLFLSTGELSLASHMAEAGKRARAGQEVRLLDIPADTSQYGIFEDIHLRPDGAAFSRDLTQACSKYYGVAARAWLELLTKKKKTALECITDHMKTFVRHNHSNDVDGQVHRAAQRFALVSAAGELATAFGITGWSQGDAAKAVKACFEEWLNSRGGVVSQEEVAVLAQVRRFFELHGESRFSPWEASEAHSKTFNRAGIKKGSEYFVFPEAFKNDIATGFDPKLFAKICIDHELLSSDAQKKATTSVRLPGFEKKVRCYKFTCKVIESEETSEDRGSCEYS